MKHKSIVRGALCLSVAAAALAGCGKSGSSSSDTNAARPINANCPVMAKNPVSAKGGSVQYNGFTIGFCCPECVETWNGWTDEKKSEFVKANTAAFNKYGPPPGGEGSVDH